MALVKHKYRVADGSMQEAKVWYYRFTYNNKTYFGSTRTANKTLAARIEAKKRAEVVKNDQLGELKTLTIRQAFDNYLASLVNKDGWTREPKRYQEIASRFNKFLGEKINNRTGDAMEVFGWDKDRDFHSLTMADFQQMVLARRNEGNQNATILNELSTLSQTIKLNDKLGFAVPSINFSSLKADNQLKPPKGRLRYLSKDEEQRLLAELDPTNIKAGINTEELFAHRQDMRDLTIILLDLGARYGEVASLKWKDIDLDKRVIHLYRPKVRNESVLAMTTRVYEVLKRRKDEIESDVYVFQAKDGGPRKYAPNAFKNACERAGIEGVSIHTLRHTNASRLVQAGVSLAEIQSLLGHSSPTTSLRYAHLVPNQTSAKAVEILNKLNGG